MPASTRQQSEAEERAATSAALEAAEEQAAQAAAAEQAAQDAVEETDSGLESSTAAEGRHKSPPSLYKCFIAHVEGGAAAHISSMTSSWFDPQSDWEGRDGERVLPLRLVCGWTIAKTMTCVERLSLIKLSGLCTMHGSMSSLCAVSFSCKEMMMTLTLIQMGSVFQIRSKRGESSFSSTN